MEGRLGTRITNCHIHTFNNDHVPRDYPAALLRPLKGFPFLIKLVVWMLRIIAQHRIADKVDRLHKFQKEASQITQAGIFEKVRKFYPDDTRFVVLPMDMTGIGYGPVKKNLREQHEELHALTQHFPGRILPFATVNPLSPGSVTEGLRAIEQSNFRGMKLYTRMGFPPDHHALMRRVYPVLQRQNLPVITHCARSGLVGKGISEAVANKYTAPVSYIPVLQQFPDMRLCLAHFGGVNDWKAYVEGHPPEGDQNWFTQIRDMIGSGQYPNLWTDISYTLFNFEEYIPFLRTFLMQDDLVGERLRSRVLFGSDFYINHQQALSERSVSFRLRNALGEEMFRQIAEVNPEVWLGERQRETIDVFPAKPGSTEVIPFPKKQAS